MFTISPLYRIALGVLVLVVAVVGLVTGDADPVLMLVGLLLGAALIREGVLRSRGRSG